MMERAACDVFTYIIKAYSHGVVEIGKLSAVMFDSATARS